MRDARLRPGRPTSRCRCRQRTDEEWRRTDLRALKLDRLAPFAGVGESGRLARRRAHAAAETSGVANESERAGVVVQRDAADALHRGRRRGRARRASSSPISTRRSASTRTWSSSYFMTEAVPVDFGKFEALHAAFWQGGSFLYVPKGVDGRAAVPLVRRSRRAGRVGLHAHAGRARGGRRGVLRRCLPLARRRRGSRSPRRWSS